MHRVRFLRSQLSLLRLYPFLAPAYRVAARNIPTETKRRGPDTPCTARKTIPLSRQPNLCRRRPMLHVVPDGYQYGRPYPYNPPGSITQRQSGIQSRRLCRQSFRRYQEYTTPRIVLGQLQPFPIRDKGHERHYQGAAQCIRHTSMDAGYAESLQASPPLPPPP